MLKRVRLVVSGLVHGVGFRMFIERAANELKLDGWVKNRADGTVEIDAQGPEELLEELIRRAKKGPSRSQVTSIRKQEEKVTDNSLSGFTIVM
jgi:acylphosphatase